MSDDKVKIIQDWLEPKKVKDIQFFLDFAKFYCWFIFNYSDIVISLTCFTWKNIPWKFDSFCHDTFNSLKRTFTSAPILTHWISDTQLIVETDALDYALTVILSIVNKDNEVHSCYNLKLELRLHLGKDLREVKEIVISGKA